MKAMTNLGAQHIQRPSAHAGVHIIILHEHEVHKVTLPAFGTHNGHVHAKRQCVRLALLLAQHSMPAISVCKLCDGDILCVPLVATFIS